MELNKLGKYIRQLDEKNEHKKFGEDAVVGLSTQKQIIRTKAALTGVNLKSYKLFPPQSFAYVPDTSRRGDKISMAFNASEEIYLVSPISVVFEVLDLNAIIPEYLFMYFNRPEFDRYARFNSWGSARETFSWDDMADINIRLPDIIVQKKYVAIYNAVLTNQHSYEHGLDDLKQVCNVYIDQLRKTSILKSIGQYLVLSDNRNECGLGTKSVRGLAVSKEIIATKADMNGVNLDNYKIVPPGYIAYVPDTSRRGDKVSLGYNNTNETFLVSSISIVFGTKQEKLLPEYLMLFFCRSEFDRYARFHSWGSARETFDWSEMCEVKIPIPDIGVQRSIVNIYNAYIERKAINDKLKEQIKDICPILIKGSLEEARGRDE